jgi:hypothetical protein
MNRTSASILIRILAALIVLGTLLFTYFTAYQFTSYAIWTLYGTVIILLFDFCLWLLTEIWTTPNRRRRRTIWSSWFFVSIAFFIGFWIWQHKASKPTPSQPTLEQPRFRADSERVVITLGTDEDIVPRSTLETTRFKPLAKYGVEGANSLVVYIENGLLYVDVKLFTRSNFPPLEIKHNQFKEVPPGWDVNFDQKVIEIVDEENAPIFQLIYKSPSEVKINGIFQISNNRRRKACCFRCS